jgi:RNA polymerase sigma factor (sigma-70 family)
MRPGFFGWLFRSPEPRKDPMLAEPSTDSFLPTRQSRLSRLRDVQDQAGWREFFDAYWRLIYNVARKSGLGDAEAQDVVQNTFIYLARRMPGFRYEPARGSFKSWLRVVTRSRIHAFRRREKAHDSLMREPLGGPGGKASDPIEEILDPAADALDEMWQLEWEENLLHAALRHLRTKVSSRQLLLFRLATSGNLPLNQVARKFGVSIARVYLARHRVGKLFKAEIQRLRRETE